ncbi:MAG: hypothetical protein EOM05_00720 [Clostridia bacterium]|nr:hypothetical protein [Clostridia bacterium]
MKNKIKLDNSLCEYLKQNHKGKDNAVSSSTLETVFNLKGTEVRSIVNHLRATEHPVCSGENGYYYAENKKEIEMTISQLNSRIMKINNAKKGLLESLTA